MSDHLCRSVRPTSAVLSDLTPAVLSDLYQSSNPSRPSDLAASSSAISRQTVRHISSPRGSVYRSGCRTISTSDRNSNPLKTTRLASAIADCVRATTSSMDSAGASSPFPTLGGHPGHAVGGQRRQYRACLDAGHVHIQDAGDVYRVGCQAQCAVEESANR